TGRPRTAGSSREDRARDARGDDRADPRHSGRGAAAPSGKRQPGHRAHDAAARPLLPYGPLGARGRRGDDPGGGDGLMDWAALGDETIDLLRRYLMIDTTNPPGNEIAGTRFLAEVLAREGIASETIEAAPGRASLQARLAGDGRLGGTEYAISELGAIQPHHDLRAPLASIVISEKTGLPLTLTARSEPGHGSMPWPDTAPHRLIRALNRLLEAERPVRVLPEVQE